jgi:hypothetical protein
MIVTNVSDLERSVFFIFDFYAVRARAPRCARARRGARVARVRVVCRDSQAALSGKLGGRVARPM